MASKKADKKVTPAPATASGSPARTDTFALQVDGLTKSFGATAALVDVNLEVRPGEVHALLGHNGSGKSTLVKVLSGYHRPDTGTVKFNGRTIAYPISKHDLEDNGVAFLHQDIGLVPSASILENVMIGRFATAHGGRIRWTYERARMRSLLREFDMSLDPNTPVGALSASERTIIGLLRALQSLEGRSGGLLVLDEATASLPVREANELLTAVREIASRGIAVLLITHHLNEPILLADTVSVLRDGRLVHSGPVAGKSERDLAELVLGAKRQHQTPVIPHDAPTEPALVADGISSGLLNAVSLTVGRGEILGLTGLSGSGHDDLPYILHGFRPSTGGTVTVGGRTFRPSSPHASREHGLALVSGDRATAGGVPTATISENVSAPTIGSMLGVAQWILAGTERSIVNELLSRFDVRGIASAAFATMSGGNQQKALVGRWMSEPPAVLLLDEPTSGVDIGAVDSILESLRDYARGGGAVILASTQYEDLARVAHRVLVFADGDIVKELRGGDVSAHELLASSYGDAADSLL